MNRILNSKFAPLACALLFGLILLPWIFFGLDLGDQSYYSLASWLLAFHPRVPSETLPIGFEAVPVWFGFFLDSIAWRIIGRDAGFLAVRVVWVVFSTLTFAGILFGFRRFFKNPNSAIIGVGLTGLVYASAAEHFALTYNHIPPILAAFSVLAWAHSFHSTEVRSQFIAALLAGFLALCAFASRIPTLAFWGLFVVFSLALTPWNGRRWGALFLGMGLSVAFLIACLIATDQLAYVWPGLEGFARGVLEKTNLRYNGGSTLIKFGSQLAKIAFGAAVFIGSSFLLEKAPPGKVRSALRFSLVGGMIIAAYFKYGINIAILVGGALVVLGQYAWRERTRLSPSVRILLGGALLVAFSTAVGSYLEGLQNYKYMLWILLPLAWNEASTSRRWVLGACACTLFITTRILWPSFPYSEPAIFHQFAAFESPALRGIRSYPTKVAAIDGLLKHLNDIGVRPGEELFAYTGESPYYPISFVYRATGTIPLLHDAALVEYPGSRWPRHFAHLRDRAIKGTLPKTIVRQKRIFPILSPSEGFLGKVPTLPTVPFSWGSPDRNWLAGEIDVLLRDHGYRLAWENDFFAVLNR